MDKILTVIVNIMELIVGTVVLAIAGFLCIVFSPIIIICGLFEKD